MDLVRLATRHPVLHWEGRRREDLRCARHGHWARGRGQARPARLVDRRTPAWTRCSAPRSAPVPLPSRASRASTRSTSSPEAAAARAYQNVVGPYRGLLPPATVRSMEEQLSGACTVEIAAFDEFARLLGEPAATAEYDHVLFDTAPTGHTCGCSPFPHRLVSSWSRARSGQTASRPLAGLEKQRVLYDATVKAALGPGPHHDSARARAPSPPRSRRRRGRARSSRRSASATRRLVANAPSSSPATAVVRDGVERQGARRARRRAGRCARCPARRCRSGLRHSSASTRSGASTHPSRTRWRGPGRLRRAGPAAPRRRARRDAPGRHPHHGKGRRREDHDLAAAIAVQAGAAQPARPPQHDRPRCARRQRDRRSSAQARW